MGELFIVKQSLSKQLSEATDIHFSKTMETNYLLFMTDKEKYKYKFDKRKQYLFIKESGKWELFAEVESEKVIVKSLRRKIFLLVKHVGKIGRKKILKWKNKK